MSTDEEIREVYEADIAEKTRIVRGKHGEVPFYDGFQGFHTFGLYDGLHLEEIVCSDCKPGEK
jgi:hypothetical protein